MGRVDLGGQHKKLIEAAEHWVTGGTPKSPPSDLAEAAKAFGVILPAELTRQPSRDFLVLAENWPTVMMFERMETQWRAGPGGAIGLDYSVLLGDGGLFSLYGVRHRRAMLDDLRIMEVAALNKMREA